ncbi:MAG: Fe-S cluster assembly ATPase SufC [bacterium]|nr:Fe-S cluster assembly ATPase SufC [bacterium]MDZ4296199.1 Fe-S cluster assembly ATPase SufC [Patescibacteria group bacterium]
MLEIKNLHVLREEKPILQGINLAIGKGELHILSGPNGSGKSTLALTIAGHPHYQVTAGSVLFHGADIGALPPEARARKGLFLAFQQPVEIPGVAVAQVLKSATTALGKEQEVSDFISEAKSALGTVGLGEAFFERAFNEGFSGGERKRIELLQLRLLKPHLALLDEIDSGLDTQGIALLGKELESLVARGASALLITHRSELPARFPGAKVWRMKEGRIDS